jgi:hypothetical protein
MRAALITTTCAVSLASPVLGEENPSLVWILSQSGVPLSVHEVGQMTVRGTEMIGVDSLTYSPDYLWPWFTVPEGPARVVALYDDAEVAYSKAAIVFSAEPPVCGEDVGGMPVDTGTGAFLDRPTAEALDALNTSMGEDCNIYDCMMAEQTGEGQFAKMIKLPDGTSYPAFSTGYGDGGYPVFLLRDANGAPTAAYADFLGVAATTDWLTPPPCPKPQS